MREASSKSNGSMPDGGDMGGERSVSVHGARLMLLSVLERLGIEEDVPIFEVLLSFMSMLGDSEVVG